MENAGYKIVVDLCQIYICLLSYVCYFFIGINIAIVECFRLDSIQSGCHHTVFLCRDRKHDPSGLDLVQNIG